MVWNYYKNKMIDLNTLLKGKGTIIKGKEYLSAEAYVTPFLERMQKYTNEFIIQVKTPNQTSITEGDEDIVYNRVNIEAVLPHEYAYEGHQQVVGFIYALDTRKPVVKEYTGAIRRACLNLCVFNPSALSVQALDPEQPIDYKFLDNCMSMTETIGATLKRYSELTFTKEECLDRLGYWIDNCITDSVSYKFGKVKLAESTPVEAYKNLFINDKSDYFTDKDFVTGFDIYNSFTDLVCNGKTKDIVNRFEKCLLVSNVLNF